VRGPRGRGQRLVSIRALGLKKFEIIMIIRDFASGPCNRNYYLTGSSLRLSQAASLVVLRSS
jgi:hypothetical protein